MTVGEQFFDRVRRRARTGRPTATRVGEQLGVGDVAARPVTASPSSRPGWSRSGVEPEQRVGIASATRYEWILADLANMCAGGATTTVYPSTNTEDVGYILADSECRVVFAEDDNQIAKLKEKKSELPLLDKVVTFDGAAGRRLDHQPHRPREARRAELLATDPGVVEERIAATRRRLARHADLHLGHHRPPQGRPAAALVLDLRGCGDRGAGHPRPRTTCSSCGCRWRTRSARCCCPPSSPAASRPRSTAGSRRSSTTSRWSSRPSWARPRASSRRRTAGSWPCRSRRAGRRRRSSTPPSRSGSRSGQLRGRGQVGAAACSSCSTRCSTGWCSARSATASAVGCASSSPARRRSTARSPSGSASPASSSSRATA